MDVIKIVHLYSILKWGGVLSAKYDYCVITQFSVMLSLQNPQRHTRSMFRMLAAPPPSVQYQSVDPQKKKKKLQ